MKVSGRPMTFIFLATDYSLARQVSVLVSPKIALFNCGSNGLADQAYCEKLEAEVPTTVKFLLDRKQIRKLSIYSD